jgi:hypothetical protein
MEDPDSLGAQQIRQGSGLFLPPETCLAALPDSHNIAGVRRHFFSEEMIFSAVLWKT